VKKSPIDIFGAYTNNAPTRHALIVQLELGAGLEARYLQTGERFK